MFYVVTFTVQSILFHFQCSACVYLHTTPGLKHKKVNSINLSIYVNYSEPVKQDTWKYRYLHNLETYLGLQSITQHVNWPGKSGHLDTQDTFGQFQGVLNTQVSLQWLHSIKQLKIYQRLHNNYALVQKDTVMGFLQAYPFWHSTFDHKMH